ncbi:MAG: AAA family ATPase [Clostridia bacterium]|nr:AAA family ATPase [Clostridia bacterium]
MDIKPNGNTNVIPPRLSTKIILFTSCKGGVGKSTVCANLAMAVAKRNRRVLLIDCDFGNRCLDLVAGFSESVVYDISDVVFNKIDCKNAILQDKRCENLYFIAAPHGFDHCMELSAFRHAVRKLTEAGNFDFVFIDTPGGIGEPLNFAAGVADTAYIVVEPTRAAIRAAERTSDFLALRGVGKRRLIVNKLAGGSVRKAKKEIISIIDTTSVKLHGVIPYDPELIFAGNKGVLVDEMLSFNVTNAFDNLAARTLGEGRRLFANIKRLRKLK